MTKTQILTPEPQFVRHTAELRVPTRDGDKTTYVTLSIDVAGLLKKMGTHAALNTSRKSSLAGGLIKAAASR